MLFRSKMSSKIIIYTKDNCPHCVNAKKLMAHHRKAYQEMKIGGDLTREDFISIFPNVKTVPHIIIDGEQIGGYDKLNEWLNTDAGKLFLAE